MNKIGERLKAERKRLGLTQAELGIIALLAPSAISQIETSSRIPETPTLIKLADALNCSIDFMLGRVDMGCPDNSKTAGLMLCGTDGKMVSTQEVNRLLRIEEVAKKYVYYTYENNPGVCIDTLRINLQRALEGEK